MHPISPNAALFLLKTPDVPRQSGRNIVCNVRYLALQGPEHGPKDRVTLKIRFCERPRSAAEFEPRLRVVGKLHDGDRQLRAVLRLDHDAALRNYCADFGP